jgi:hypothetical protein
MPSHESIGTRNIAINLSPIHGKDGSDDLDNWFYYAFCDHVCLVRFYFLAKLFGIKLNR